MAIFVEVSSRDRQVGKTGVAVALARMLKAGGVKVELRSASRQMEAFMQQRVDYSHPSYMEKRGAGIGATVIIRDEVYPRTDDVLEELFHLLPADLTPEEAKLCVDDVRKRIGEMLSKGNRLRDIGL